MSIFIFFYTFSIDKIDYKASTPIVENNKIDKAGAYNLSKTTYPKEHAGLLHHFYEKYGYNLMADPYQMEYVLNI
ncbi:hypothetical protein D1835_13305 [Enterococcus asini]|nr:hypothetical protein [Enterococcus asini]